MADNSQVTDAGNPTPDEARRLSGWKEIARYVGRGTRTVQRWEKGHGLPVRRLAGRGGRAESVFAFAAEVDEWLASAAATRARAAAREDEEAPDAEGVGLRGEASGNAPERTAIPSSPRRLASALVVAVLIAVVAAVLWYALGPRGRGVGVGGLLVPASARVEIDTLRVFDRDGAEIWRHRFPGPAVIGQDAGQPSGTSRDSIRFQDVDADGSYETLARILFDAPNDGQSGLYLFDGRGNIRWAYRFEGSARFGARSYAGPYLPYRLFVTPSPDDATDEALWLASIHGQMFPTVLQRIDPRTGRASGQYWSNGYIEAVQVVTLGGRQVLLVGACNNESEGASLAVLDATDFSGSAPAGNPHYRCSTCPAPRPLQFIVFPKPPRFADLDATSGVKRLDVAWDGLVVGVEHAVAPDGGATAVGFYRFNRDLVPVDADAGDGYLATAAALERALLIPPGSREVNPEGEFFPLQRWNGAAFVPLPLSR